MTYAQPAADPTAVLGRRFLALLVDLAIATAVVGALLVPAFNDRARTLSADEFQCNSSFEDLGGRTPITSAACFQIGDEIRFLPDDQTEELSGLLYGALGGVVLLNSIVLQGLTGASVGKLLTGLRVVRQDTGTNANMGWQALRALLGVIDAACCFIIGGVLVLSTKGHRRLGDMAAGTVVVAASSTGTPPVVPGLNAPDANPVPWNGPQPAGGAAWGPPATGSTWTPPPPGDPTAISPPPPVAPPPAPTAQPDTPIWDDARSTYILYESDPGRWVQWDEAASAWKPIDQ